MTCFLVIEVFPAHHEFHVQYAPVPEQVIISVRLQALGIM